MVAKRKKYKPQMPWMTKALLVSTRKKNKLYKPFMAKRNPIQKCWHKKYKNKLTHLIKNAKNNQKATRKLISEVINKQMQSSLLPTSFKTRSYMVTDPKDIANSFCKYFANIGPELASKIPHQNVSFRTLLNLNNGSMFVYPTNKNELQDILVFI